METTLFTDLLQVLRVPHTNEYSVRRFRTMPFSTLFGMKKLLEEYGVQSQGYRLAKPEDIAEVPVPFVLQTRDGLVIVTSINGGTATYLTLGNQEKIPVDRLDEASTGVVFVARAGKDAREPEYGHHRMLEIAGVVKSYLFAIGLAFLIAYFFVANRLYSDWSVILLLLFDMVGFELSYLLMQKSAGFKSKRGDKVCGVLEAGGCDSILKMKSSTFFGIVSWSEVGLAYFSVSLIVTLLFPQYIGYLALCNLCCLPFTCWSIWYQKFRARHWCTLCVSVQCTLWCLFFCYFGGGWLTQMFPISWPFFAIGVAYMTVLLALNRLSPVLKRAGNRDDNYPEMQ